MDRKKIADNLAEVLEFILRLPVTVLGFIQFLIVLCFLLVFNPLISLVEGRAKEIPKDLKGVIGSNFKRFVTSLWDL